MTVYDVLYYATDDTAYIDIYNFANDISEIMTVDEAKDKYGECELMSFDSYISNNTLCLNINTDF